MVSTSNQFNLCKFYANEAEKLYENLSFYTKFKIIHIMCFNGYEFDILLLKYILRNGWGFGGWGKII